MIKIVLVGLVAQFLCCNAGGLLGGDEPMDINGEIPQFARALKLANISKPMIEITGASKRIVSGVLYTVKFSVGSKPCFVESGYSSSVECAAEKELCELKYVVQAWKKDDLTLAGDANDICSPNTAMQDGQNAINPSLNSTSDASLRKLFDQFIHKYGREYRADSNDGKYGSRFQVFKKNFRRMKKFKETEMGTGLYGITKFMDYTEEEFKNLAPGFAPQKHKPRFVDVQLNPKTPVSYDWRDHGAVTEVKNQRQCGSCWAFSTTGNVEGQWAIKKGKLVSLSEQELVDCDKTDLGCGGGLPANAYKSIEKLGGLETESEYPYEGADEKCKFKSSDVAVYINDSISLPTDEAKLATWLSENGPISIGINANAMQFYFGGISHPWKFLCNPKKLDHGVLIVGYGVEDGTPYWIIKNSWGPGWGEKGYYRIYRGDGSCGLNMMATSSVVY